VKRVVRQVERLTLEVISHEPSSRGIVCGNPLNFRQLDFELFQAVTFYRLSESAAVSRVCCSADF